MTVALVAIPQCMGFAAIAGLPPVMGLYASVVMGLVGGILTSSNKSIIGPAITTSSMVYGVLASVAPRQQGEWPAIAGLEIRREGFGWKARRYRPRTGQNQRIVRLFGALAEGPACRLGLVNHDFMLG